MRENRLGRTDGELGLNPPEAILRVLSLQASLINLGAGRTNMLQGLVHLILVFTYVVLIFD